MMHLVGMDDVQLRAGRYAPVVLDSRALINGHMLFAGMSGMGKSYQMMALMNSAIRQGIEMDVFDPHEEIEVAGATAVKFSEATRAGYNPLEINVDMHSGGVRRQIAFIIDIINRTSRKLGPRQESALRNLLGDVYHLRGIRADEQSTWARQSIDEPTYEQMVRARNWSGLRDFYPVLQDVISYADRVLKRLTLGADSQAANALERVEESATRIQRLQARHQQAATDEEVNTLQARFQAEKDRAIEAFANFVNSIESGRELADVLKYTNRETLQSLLERLHGLLECGVMRANPPDWGGASTRIYRIGSLTDDAGKLLFFMRAQAILRECMDAGKTPQLRRLLVVDEGHRYYSDDPDNPINRIAKEGRKFGLGLVIGSQSPTHFSEDFLTNCGTVFLLGLHENYWDMACRRMNLSRDVLARVAPKQILLLKKREEGVAAATFHVVNIDARQIAAGLDLIQRARASASA